MQNQNLKDLYGQFTKIMENGTESEARQFIISNFSSFPDDVQDGLTMAFFEEAVTKEAEDLRAIAGVQKIGIATMSDLEKAKRVLDDAVKSSEIKESIDK